MARARRPATSDAMRSLAAFFAECEPDVCAVHGIEVGDALALATRFDRGWAHRGGQALFWNTRVAANAVRDTYLPASPRRPFERRGLLRVDGACDGVRLTLVATELSDDRATRIADVRFVRTHVRAVAAHALIFVASPDRRFPIGGRGFDEVAFSNAPLLSCRARGVDVVMHASIEW